MGKEKVEVLKRTIKIGDEEKVIEIVKPNPKIEAEANMYASKIFAKLIKQKNEDGSLAFMLRSQLDAFLKEIGVYTDDDIRNMGFYAEKITELESKLISGGITKSQGKKLALELRGYRWALLSILGKKMDYDKNTVEYFSENARMDFLVTKCICFEGGAPIFESVDDYESDSVMQEVLAEPIRELASLVSNFDPNYEHKLVENKFLKKYGFCDDNGNLINEDGQLIDEDGKLISKEIGEFLDDEVEAPTEESPAPVTE